MRYRVRGASVFSVGIVVEVHLAAYGIDNYVLKNAAKHLGGVIDLGLSLSRETDDLRIASTFKIKHAVTTPTVLVIPDQGS